MVNGTVSIFKFVGTISLGLLTGVSASLSTIALPALLTLPTASDARTTLTYTSSKTRLITSYLRHITTFSLFSAYLLSPRRWRHPYLLYTSILTFISGYGVDNYMTFVTGSNIQRANLDLEAQGDDVNGEQVRTVVQIVRTTEKYRAIIVGLGFAMNVVGLWGDGALFVR
ncbi:hypothetical protein P280DRAFT_551185 [Massarina eburnea CBS 473.64]|uniref:Uncharacterized protein n=1 Tax=Massarina eburnea CBS 473.64 TaxID=1395130 RepID=A0A6A6RWI3_9PLEO|nr:hypothetical protein P280DRAFT_551185 [Massarina eburnea CBS 473.64]